MKALLKKLPLLIVVIGIILFTNCKSESSIDEKVESILKQLTLEEKIGMIHGSGKFTNGGVPRLGIPELRMSDGPCGVRMEMNRDDWGSPDWTNDNGLYLPAGTALAATWDTSLARLMGTALGQEAKIRGKNVQLAPGINIIRTPLCGRNWEYMSEDPFFITQMVVPLIQGLQSNGVAACVKHYALNNQEVDRGTIDVNVSERALREIYLPGFEAAVKDAKSLTIMGSYNKFRGQYATYNKYLIMDILKGEWNFKGVVISDWDACHNTIEAAENGLDIEMGTEMKFDEYYMAKPLLDSVKAGKVDIRNIDDKVRRILRLVLELNLLNEKPFDTTGMYAKLAIPERIVVAKKVAEESVVLLKNNGNMLPLNLENIKTIALIGDNADRKHSLGGGSTTLKARYEVTPLEALKKKLGDKIEIKFARGFYAPDIRWGKDEFRNKADEKLAKEAIDLAKKSDLVLYFGGLNHNWGNDAEAADKPDLSLPYGQDNLIKELIKANPKTVVVLLCGSPLDLTPWMDKVPAILQTSFLGMEAGTVITEALLGEINPSGKLTMTFPKKLSDSPEFALGEYPGKDGKVNYNEGLLVGYRYYDTKNVEPLFPFGYGLSYTKFDYSNLILPAEMNLANGKIEVSCEIKNIGKVEGKEIVQLYVHEKECKVERPIKELKAFTKVSLKPGESKKVSLAFDKKAFAYYDDVKKDWVVNPGKFDILIGASSADIRLKGETTIK